MDASGGIERISSMGSLRAMDRVPSMGSFVGLDKVPSVGSFTKLWDPHQLAEPAFAASIGAAASHSAQRNTLPANGPVANGVAGVSHMGSMSSVAAAGLPRVPSLQRVGSLPRISSFYSLTRDAERMGSASNLLALASSAPAANVSNSLDQSSSFQNLAALARSASGGYPAPTSTTAASGSLAPGTSLNHTVVPAQHGGAPSLPPSTVERYPGPAPGPHALNSHAGSSPAPAQRRPQYIGAPQSLTKPTADAAGMSLGNSEVDCPPSETTQPIVQFVPADDVACVRQDQAIFGASPGAMPSSVPPAVGSPERMGASDLIAVLSAQLKTQERCLQSLTRGASRSCASQSFAALRGRAPRVPFDGAACGGGSDGIQDDEHAHLAGASSVLQSLASGGSSGPRRAGGNAIEKKPPGRRHQRVLERLRKHLEYLIARGATLKKLSEAYKAEFCSMQDERRRLRNENEILQAQIAILKTAKAASMKHFAAEGAHAAAVTDCAAVQMNHVQNDSSQAVGALHSAAAQAAHGLRTTAAMRAAVGATVDESIVSQQLFEMARDQSAPADWRLRS